MAWLKTGKGVPSTSRCNGDHRWSGWSGYLGSTRIPRANFPARQSSGSRPGQSRPPRSQEEPRLFRRCRRDHAMPESCEKLRHHRLHVRIIFYEQDMRHRLTISVGGCSKLSGNETYVKEVIYISTNPLIGRLSPALPTTQLGPTKSLHPQRLGPKLPRGWGAGRSRSQVCAAAPA